jgi:hypothetical protein
MMKFFFELIDVGIDFIKYKINYIIIINKYNCIN